MDTTQILALVGAILLVVAAIAFLVFVLVRVRRSSGRPAAQAQPVPATNAGEVPSPAEPQPEPEPELQPAAPHAPVATDDSSDDARPHVIAHPRDPAPRAPIHPGAPEQVEPSGDRPGPAYTPVGPVEIRFQGDPSRIGVAPGTDAFDSFVRVADDLIAELQRARGESQPE